ncbi:hypothetical protein BJF96_g6774 [Verticillium dahliae]|uniref:F-box domain-containing protein n=1 Tax=Verticillium dahliae TaxID=27337 RepID=A0AA44WE22_VERDA|nr:hypothetical protein VdG2_04889 [Verticillium dahliae VDG2]PNH29939.1 hypothetical protein BJF96_g6774 [Verticillium dahliae]
MASQPPQLSASGATSFGKVPLEVFLRITDHLTTVEHGNLRLTCRSIERSLFTTFSREFFSKKQFMLTEHSLQALIDMSTSRIGDCLKHIIIGLDYYKEGPPVHSQAKATLYTAGCDDQRTFLWTGQAVLMLTEAFRNLQPTVVGMRDYASDARQFRDGSRAKWASYGATTVWKETGVSLLGGSGYDDEVVSVYASQVFSIILAALAGSGATPTTIEVLRHHHGRLRATAFNIPKYLKPSLLPVLSRIETMFLPLDVVRKRHDWDTSTPARYASADGSEPDMEICPDYLFRVFLSHLPNLKHLRLNFHRNDTPTDLLKWLADPSPDKSDTSQLPATPNAPNILRLPRAVDFPCLESIDFGILTIDQESLLNVIRKFAPTLKGVELWKVTLVRNSAEASDVPSRRNLWRQFFGRMRHIDGLKLKHMMVGQPLQRLQQRSAVYNVTFKSLSRGGTTNAIQKRAYQGNEWDEWIQDMAADVVVEGRSGVGLDDTLDDSSSDDPAVDDEDDHELFANEEWDDWMNGYDGYELGAALDEIWDAGFSPTNML